MSNSTAVTFAEITMTNTNKLALKALTLGAALGLASSLPAQTLLQDKPGYDDVAYDTTKSGYYISLEDDELTVRKIDESSSFSPKSISFSPVATYDAQAVPGGAASHLLNSNGDITLFYLGGAESLTSISLNPAISGATSFVGGASNQSNRSEFLAVGDNDTFSVYDSTGIAKWTYDNNIASGRTIVDLEGSVTENNGSAYFTGVFKYLDNNNAIADEFESVSDIELTAVPEPSTYAAIVGALALGAAATRRRAKNLEYNLEK